MKKLIVAMFALSLLVLGAPITSAAHVEITISEPTHREIGLSMPN